jgi:anti-sigma B factor antagonist
VTAIVSIGPIGLQVDIRPGTPAVAYVSGEIDLASAPWLRATLLPAIRRYGPSIWVDLQRVTFLDASGITVLLSTMQRAAIEGGRMRVVRPSPQAWRVVTILGLADLLSGDRTDIPIARANAARASATCYPGRRTG